MFEEFEQRQFQEIVNGPEFQELSVKDRIAQAAFELCDVLYDLYVEEKAQIDRFMRASRNEIDDTYDYSQGDDLFSPLEIAKLRKIAAVDGVQATLRLTNRQVKKAIVKSALEDGMLLPQPKPLSENE